jgi:hypothetical protein
MARPDPSPVVIDEAARQTEVDEVLAEFGGDARAAIGALLDDLATLVADAEEAVSRGFLRGRFSEGARRPAVDDDP